MGRVSMERRVIETGLGGIEIIVKDGALAALNFTRARPTRPRATEPIVSAIMEYSRGEHPDLSGVPLDLSSCTPFEKDVYEATRQIPFGKVATYGQVAAAIGRPNAARAVGQALRKNPIAIVIPCHRVVASDSLGGFSSGLVYKRRLLRLEGVLR